MSLETKTVGFEEALLTRRKAQILNFEPQSFESQSCESETPGADKTDLNSIVFSPDVVKISGKITISF